MRSRGVSPKAVFSIFPARNSPINSSTRYKTGRRLNSARNSVMLISCLLTTFISSSVKNLITYTTTNNQKKQQQAGASEDRTKKQLEEKKGNLISRFEWVLNEGKNPS